jgi:AraC family transcriptional regulator, regulatory protein of adaptative response / methylated-DNA-[protein]-cysteine methyltransferase
LSKEQLNQILKERDWKTLKVIISKDKGIIRHLMSRIYIKDGLIFWRAVEALGRAAFELEKLEPGYSVELVRRYFWSLNEESGGTAWNAAEAIGSIMYYNPKECGHFNWMYTGLLEDENLQQGVLWGLVHFAMRSPEVIYPLAESVRPFLESQDSSLRGLALWIYILMQDHDLEKEMWSVPDGSLQGFSHENEFMDFYLDGELKKIQVSEVSNFQMISCWSELINIGEYSWFVTVASTSKGLCWVGLGTPEEEEEALKVWVKRWIPQAIVIRRRIPNETILSELKEYFSGIRKEFSVPLISLGTPFQLRVWEELRRIPYGETQTYSDIAHKIGNPKGQRAVGLANNKNPIGVVVPCHRVIGKNGDLVGYAGGIDLKERLLRLEAMR